MDPGLYYIFFLSLLPIFLIIAMVIAFIPHMVTRNAEGRDVSVRYLIKLVVIFLLWMVSQILQIYFYFIIANFQQVNYIIAENILVWKIGGFLNAMGIVLAIYIIEREVIVNEFRYIFAIIPLALGIIQLVYPISTLLEFEVLSYISTNSGLTILCLPFMFIIAAFRIPTIKWELGFIALGYSLMCLGNFIMHNFYRTGFTTGLDFNIQHTIYTGILITGLLFLYKGYIYSVPLPKFLKPK